MEFDVDTHKIKEILEECFVGTMEDTMRGHDFKSEEAKSFAYSKIYEFVDKIEDYIIDKQVSLGMIIDDCIKPPEAIYYNPFD